MQSQNNNNINKSTVKKQKLKRDIDFDDYKSALMYQYSQDKKSKMY